MSIMGNTGASRQPTVWIFWGLMLIVSGSGATLPAETSPTTPEEVERAPLGEHEKIRFFFSQWWHFNDQISDQELMRKLAKVGATVFADWGCNPERGRAAQAQGIYYFAGFATAKLRGPAEQYQTRLAVDKTGKTCLERFADYVAAGGDPDKPWGFWGEHKGAYIPCPLDRRPWDEAIVKPILQAVRQGVVDGLNLDQEPYGAYKFDLPGDMLCYCDDCFGRYLKHRDLKVPVERKDRYAWLEQRGELDAYLKYLQARLIAMFQQIAADIRAIRPHFTFSSYPGFPTPDLRGHWRWEALALGFNSPQAPFIVVDSVPYWEDPTRPWWDSAAEAYRRMGLRHVMGSWDNGQMGGHAESHLGAADLMYELAMATDGFWRWGESAFGTDDWRTFAMAHQKLRQVESRLGDFLFQGQPEPHFVTLIEQTGNPLLERALVVRTWRHNGRYLMRLFNGNTDWPIYVRLRLPRVQGAGPWRLRDPLHDVDFVHDAGATWDRAALREGLVVPMQGRGELFLLLEEAPGGYRRQRYRSVSSLDFDMHQPRGDETQELPPTDTTLGPRTVVYTDDGPGGYTGSGPGYSLVSTLALADVDTGSRGSFLHLPGFCRQPRFSPDGRHLAASVYVNGQGQIYLVNAEGHQRRNISHNDGCDRSPRFTPDGQRIVFVSDRDGDWNIYSMNRDGSDPRRLTDSPGTDCSPAVSPDGRHIAFISDRDGDFELFLMDADGSNQRVLNRCSGNEYEPIWSPDGQWVASTVRINNMRGIQMMDREGHNLRHYALGEATDLYSIRVSPDGTKIAGAFRRYEQAGILVIDLQAGPPQEAAESESQPKPVRELVTAEPIRPYPDSWYRTGTGSPRWVNRTFSGVSFSPDGQHLLYCSDQEAGSPFRLYTVPLEGGEAKAIPGTETPWPVDTDWSPR